MMLASGSNLSPTICTIFSASFKVKSELPEMLIKAPLALEMSMSNNGLLNASCTDSIALSPDSDSPIPIIAIPEPFMIELMSAKSKLISPGLVMSSVIPLTALPKISSEAMKALFKGRLGATSNNLSLGITITVSAFS